MSVVCSRQGGTFKPIQWAAEGMADFPTMHHLAGMLCALLPLNTNSAEILMGLATCIGHFLTQKCPSALGRLKTQLCVKVWDCRYFSLLSKL